MKRKFLWWELSVPDFFALIGFLSGVVLVLLVIALDAWSARNNLFFDTIFARQI